jgi:hypothetical protein
VEWFLITFLQQKTTKKAVTFVSVVGDGAEVEEVRADDGVADGVALPELDLDPLAKRREHLGEDDLEPTSQNFLRPLFTNVSN